MGVWSTLRSLKPKLIVVTAELAPLALPVLPVLPVLLGLVLPPPLLHAARTPPLSTAAPRIKSRLLRALGTSLSALLAITNLRSSM
jgi:hypothetical protein